MAKKRKGNPIHGWLNFYKPLGMNSTHAVGMLKRMFNAQKVGHGGTLDPLAEGVLPIAFGEATKTMQFSLEGQKSYEFTIQFGTQTNTDDKEGEVTERSDARPTREALEQILPQFTGILQQTPPLFSAIKIDGKRAYARARAGEDMKMKTREVTIYKIEILAFDTETALLQCDVSKGTYVRSLAKDMALALGCFGHVATLKRVKAAGFDVKDAITQEMLDECVQKGQSPETFLQPVGAILDDIPEYKATAGEVRLLKAGGKIQRIHIPAGLRKVVNMNDKLISLVRFDEKGKLEIVRNFNLDIEENTYVYNTKA